MYVHARPVSENMATCVTLQKIGIPGFVAQKNIGGRA
jgi:hypothetical protein